MAKNTNNKKGHAMGIKMKLKETMAGFKHHPQLSKCKVKLAYCLLPFGEM